MRRMSRLFFAASLLSLSALLPMGALAAGTLTENVVGAEYAVGTCPGGQTGSFAGYGSATPWGPANAAFNTTICHTSLNGGTADINPGGDFELATRSVVLVGQYISGKVGPGSVTRHGYFCTEVFPVTAELGPATFNVPKGATNIASGSSAVGALTGLLRPVRPTTTRNDTSKGANIQIVRYLFKADFFKVLGHPLRIQILDELRNGPVSVGELRERLQVEQSTLSHQPALLRARNFV